jgi:hypothetical protein
MCRRRMTGNFRRRCYYFCFYEAKLCLRKILCNLIRLLFFSQQTPLHYSAARIYLGKNTGRELTDVDEKTGTQWITTSHIGGDDQLEVSRLLVESRADVAARTRCFSPPPSHHLSLTICLAAKAKLHSHWPSNNTHTVNKAWNRKNKAKERTIFFYTCAASAPRNDALTPPAAPFHEHCKRHCSNRKGGVDAGNFPKKPETGNLLEIQEQETSCK